MKQQPGVLYAPEVLAFHRTVLHMLAGAGGVRLFRLCIDAQPIAVLYVLWGSRAACYYIGGFSPEFDRFSPGSLLIRHVIRECIESTIREFYFLRGLETYKYRWKAEDRPVYRLTILPRPAAGAVYDRPL
jgi:CelD/BcsL family acetyltransferase involved in cellulose biosynthesis